MNILKYIYHDCFHLKSTGKCSLVFDFWKDPRVKEGEYPLFLNEIERGKPCYIFVSHHHKDHFTREIFEWARDYPEIFFILSKDTAKMARHILRPESIWNGYKVSQDRFCVLKPGEEYNDETVKIKAYDSTDIGNSYAVEIRVAQRDGTDLKVFHAGDLNAWIWLDESTQKEVTAAMSQFDNILYSIRDDHKEFDVAMFPVDSRIGRDYFTGARLFLKSFKVKRFFPMHFGLGENAEEDLKYKRDATAFQDYANPDYGECIGLLSPGDCICF